MFDLDLSKENVQKTNPGSFLIISPPKAGKTSSILELKNYT